jgi:hypothetical protein
VVCIFYNILDNFVYFQEYSYALGSPLQNNRNSM